MGSDGTTPGNLRSDKCFDNNPLMPCCTDAASGETTVVQQNTQPVKYHHFEIPADRAAEAQANGGMYVYLQEYFGSPTYYLAPFGPVYVAQSRGDTVSNMIACTGDLPGTVPTNGADTEKIYTALCPVTPAYPHIIVVHGRIAAELACIGEVRVCSVQQTIPNPPSAPLPPSAPPSPGFPENEPRSPPPPAPVWPLPTETENLQTYRDILTAANKKMFFMLYVRNNVWMNADLAARIPANTFPSESWINDRESREFFMRLVRDMGHGYAHANAGKPINWYHNNIYSASRCEDVTDPLQNYFSMKNMGRGYDVDGIFEYGQGDALTDVEFKFHAIGCASCDIRTVKV